MNKKLFLGMFAAAGMLLTTSCEKDELEVVQSSGNEAQVTFSLGLEGGLATRAAATISNGQKADYLVYAVYKYASDGTTLELQKVTGADDNSQLFKENAFANGLTDQVTVTLAKGQKYKVAFWAQDDDCKAYTTTSLQAVKVSYKNEAGSDAANNDETRDAFFGTVDFNVNGDEVINDIILKRPFAQINVGVHQKDWNDAVASGIEITESQVVIKNVADQIDLLTGKVTGQKDITYSWATIPAQFDTEEGLFVDLDKDGTKEEYKYLSMSYILANDTYEQDADQDGFIGDEKTTVESLDFTFSPESGNDINLHDGLNQVPVRRNWRTNIIGTILTGDVQLNITIDPAYEGEYNPYDQLQEVLANGGKITLFDDMTLSEELTIPENVEIDLNKNTLTVKSENTVTGNLKIKNGNVIVDGGTFYTMENSTLDFSEANVRVAANNFGVVVKGNGVSVNLNKTTMTVEGNEGQGIFAYGPSDKNLYNGLNINLTESRISGEYALYLMWVDATVTLDEKSSANKFWVCGAETNVNVVYAGEKPVVNTDNTANTITYYYKPLYDLKTALENGTSEISLAQNVDYGTITVDELKDVTITGANGAKMIFKTTADTKIENVTLKGVNFEYTGATVDCGIVIDANAQIDNLVIDGCTVTGTGAKAGRGLSGHNNNASIVIKNTTFKDLGYPIYAWGGYKSLSIEGCTFDNIKSWAIMPQSGFDGDLTVTGCTFKNCLGGGLIKAGTLTAGHTFTFTNNTITGCTIEGDHNWFQFNVSAGTSVISGNTKDDAAWTPTTTDGLK